MGDLRPGDTTSGYGVDGLALGDGVQKEQLFTGSRFANYIHVWLVVLI